MMDTGSSDCRKKVGEVKQTVWADFFRTDDKAFRKKEYAFHFMIKTDGIGCSILFHRSDLNPEHLPKAPETSMQV